MHGVSKLQRAKIHVRDETVVERANVAIEMQVVAAENDVVSLAVEASEELLPVLLTPQALGFAHCWRFVRERMHLEPRVLYKERHGQLAFAFFQRVVDSVVSLEINR